MMQKESEKNIILKMGKDFLDFIEHKQLFDVIWFRTGRQDVDSPCSWGIRQTINLTEIGFLEIPRRIKVPSPLLRNPLEKSLKILERFQYDIDGIYCFHSYDPNSFSHEADDQRECLNIKGQGTLEVILFGEWMPNILEASKDFRFQVPECHIFCRSPTGFTPKAEVQFKDFEREYVQLNPSMCQVKTGP